MILLIGYPKGLNLYSNYYIANPTYLIWYLDRCLMQLKGETMMFVLLCTPSQGYSVHSCCSPKISLSTHVFKVKRSLPQTI